MMATFHKGEGDAFTEQEDSGSTNDEYFHNPEDFIDIHANEKSVKVIENESVHSIKTLVADPRNKCSWSGNNDQYNSNCDLKTPVQVSEDNDPCLGEKLESRLHNEDSESEYHSADDGEVSSGDELSNLNDSNCNKAESNEETFSSNDFAGRDVEKDDSTETDEIGLEIVDDLETRKKAEEILTEEEKLERKTQSQNLKDEGNSHFRNAEYDEAIKSYTEALDICPLMFPKERSIMFANRAACNMKKELFTEAIKDSTNAIDLHPHYLKAILRRAELYEKTEKLDEALQDYQKVVELDPSQTVARAACMKLSEQIKERNEKLKEEMLGKLKDLGNLVLRPFGLSVNNFKVQQDPNSGSYSVQFQQNSANNGH